jgi:hypothetical protein
MNPGRARTRLRTMIGLAILLIKLCFKFMLLGLWLFWAMLALPVAGVCLMSGNKRAAHQWMRSMRWDIF